MQASDAQLSQKATIFYLRFALFLAGAFLVAMNLSELHSQLEDGCSQQSVDLVSRWMVYYRRPVCSFENMFEHIILNAVRIIFNVQDQPALQSSQSVPNASGIHRFDREKGKAAFLLVVLFAGKMHGLHVCWINGMSFLVA